MKKLLYILPLVALLITSCKNSNEINGKLSNKDYDGKMIYLFEFNKDKGQFMPTDSTTIENATFAFKKAETDTPTLAFCAIKEATGTTPKTIPFVYENGNVQITVDSIVTVKGTPTNDAYQKFINEMYSMEKDMNKLAQSSNPSMEEYKALGDKISTSVYNYIKSNIKTPFGEILLMNYANFLTPEQVQSLISEASKEFQDKLKFESQNVEVQDPSNNMVGKQYIDVSGETPDGKKIALSDYVGKNKLVLIDFWASWCGPCIQEMPTVVKAYSLFKDKGFEVVGISLDEKKQEWTAAIQKLNMTWPQMSDLKGWQSSLSMPYNVKGIPYTLLVNEKGEVIAENLRGDQLINKLSEILK